MIEIAFVSESGVAYIVADTGFHYICVGFSGNEKDYTCTRKFLVNRDERAALGTLGSTGTLDRNPAEAEHQQMAVVSMACYKNKEAESQEAALPSAQLSLLAERIINATAQCPKWDPTSAKRPWYMVNINNPVVDKLLRRYCAKNGIVKSFPLSDMERITFELQLMRPGVLRELDAAAAMVEKDNDFHKRRQKESG